MEVNDIVRRKLVDGLMNRQGRIEDAFKNAIFKINKAESAEMVMRAKANLLYDILEAMPIYGDECYFCILHRESRGSSSPSCVNCEWAVRHGVCSFIKSDWMKIRSALDSFKVSVGLYYGGETYHTPTEDEQEDMLAQLRCVDEEGDNS